MNRSTDPVVSTEILYLGFNQTSTFLCVGTKTGYLLYELDQVQECRPIFESRELVDVCIIQKNFSTSLTAYVSLKSPRTLIIYNFTKGTEISSRIFHNTVLAVKLNRKNLVVCLENTICIYNISGHVHHDHSITDVPSNKKGLLAMSYGNLNTIIAYPVSAENGDVQIFDATAKHAKTTILAHASQLAALALDEDGEMLATASIKGTVIRVFSVSSCDILFEFRRGVKRCVEINCLSFDMSKEFLCASSNTETVHIFKLVAPEPPQQVEEESEGWIEMFGRVLSQSVQYLPTQMSDVLTQQRSFAVVHLPFVDQKNVCAITKIQNVTYVLVATLEGFLYMYELNTEVGGPCHLVKQHRLEGPFEPKVKVNSTPNPQLVTTSENVDSQKLDTHIVTDIDRSSSKESSLINELSQSEASSIHRSNGIDEMPPLLNEVE